MSWYGSLWVHLVWDLLSLYLVSVFFFRFWKFSSIASSNTLSILVLFSFCNTYYVSVVMSEIISQISYVAFVLSLSFCLLFSFSDFHYSIFQVIYLLCGIYSAIHWFQICFSSRQLYCLFLIDSSLQFLVSSSLFGDVHFYRYS